MVSLKKYIYIFGQSIRNPSLNSIYEELKNNENTSPPLLKEQQLEKFREIIRFAYNNSKYYNKIYREAGFHPDDFKTFEDITKIPIITKQELIKYLH